jgi:anthranilate synthase component 2
MKSSLNPKVLVIDNYDSFTYNLVHLLHECGEEVEVWRNDKFKLEDVEAFDKILLSPGPGLPKDAGLLMDLIKKYSATKRILGICLGQQAIAEVYGGRLSNLDKPVHGMASKIKVIDSNERLFQHLPAEFLAGRYHSWVVSEDDFPLELEVTARDESGFIMAIAHKDLDVRGVQFHPESILSEHGKEIIQNWLRD